MSSQARNVPGLIVAAPRSGAGKTTITLGLMRALRRSGVCVQPFKCGPDYIDAAFHAAATGRSAFNLDTWSMRGTLIDRLLAVALAGAGIAVAEGVMGLFDGAAGPGQSGRGATADLAARLGWPVVLVIDVSGQTETAAAVALGCARYRDDVTIAGVILNKVASPRHLDLIAPAFDRIGIPVLGWLPRNDQVILPQRHLGLVQAEEMQGIDQYLDHIAELLCAHVDLGRIITLARPARPSPASEATATEPAPFARLQPPGQRIAVAQDTAFSFVYPHVLWQWRQAGAGIMPFSPLADEAPDCDADAVWLPGGYPELHAATIAAAGRFKAGLRAAAERGIPIHGECGGYMVLGTGLVDADGNRHEMAGLLGLETSFSSRRLHLGYRHARLLRRCALGPPGHRFTGHEFHYASILTQTDEPLLECRDAAGQPVPEAGAVRGPVSGSYVHMLDAVEP